MKKLLCILFSFIIIFVISAPASAEVELPIGKPEETIISELTAAIPFEFDIRVSDSLTMPRIFITYSCESLADEVYDDFALMIYIAKEYCNQSFQLFHLMMDVYVDDRDDYLLHWSSSSTHFGFFCDTSSGTAEGTFPENDEDLFAYFPHLEQDIADLLSQNPDTLSFSRGKTILETIDTETDYIVNNRSKRYHRMDCDSAPLPSSQYYSVENSTRQDLESKGYQPCPRCFETS